MNKKQKILTWVMLPVFLLAGLIGAGISGGEIGLAFTWWFATAVVYAALFFLLGPTRPN